MALNPGARTPTIGFAGGNRDIESYSRVYSIIIGEFYLSESTYGREMPDYDTDDWITKKFETETYSWKRIGGKIVPAGHKTLTKRREEGEYTIKTTI